MAWVCARKVTEEDHEILDERAQAFIDRHDLSHGMNEMFFSDRPSTWGMLEEYLDCMIQTNYYNQEWVYLRRLWRKVFERATGCPNCTGVAYRCIGYATED